MFETADVVHGIYRADLFGRNAAGDLSPLIPECV